MIRTIKKPTKKIKKNPKKPNKKTLILPPNSKSALFHPNFPEEIIFSEILTRLPIKTLIQFKSISKSYNSLISSQYFINSHLNTSINNQFAPFNCVFIKSAYSFLILNYNAYNNCPDNYNTEKKLINVKSLSYIDNGINTFLIGGFNGLICFGRGGINSRFNYYFIVYNPVIGDFSRVLDPLGNFQFNLICGFCYIECKDDYFLFICGLQKKTTLNYVYVFSMKAKSWKKIGVFDTDEFSVFSGGGGVFVNGTLHWDKTQVWTPKENCVLGFNLIDERFVNVRVPPVFSSNVGGLECKLCEISGCLGVWGADMSGVGEIWMLREYGVWESWGMVYKIDVVPGLRGFCGWFKNGEVLVQTDDGSILLADFSPSPTVYKSVVRSLGDIETVGFVRGLCFSGLLMFSVRVQWF